MNRLGGLGIFPGSQLNIMRKKVAKLRQVSFFLIAAKVMLSTEKGKPIERLGRKATGLRALAYDSGVASTETAVSAFAPIQALLRINQHRLGCPPQGRQEQPHEGKPIQSIS